MAGVVAGVLAGAMAGAVAGVAARGLAAGCECSVAQTCRSVQVEFRIRYV